MTNTHDAGIPAYWSLRNPDELAEERRLLYVGMTRARQILELTYPRTRTLPGGRVAPGEPSRFLATLPPSLATLSNMR